MLTAVLLSACSALEALQLRPLIGPMGETRVHGRPGLSLTVVARDGVRLEGYLVPAAPPIRGTVLLLHGVGAQSSVWRDDAITFAAHGFHAVAWDARGHGASRGYCTYGARERDDVTDVLDALGPTWIDRPVLLYGYSMGAAVAIQAAAREPRIGGLVAIAPFTTLDGVIRRVAWGVPRRLLDDLLLRAERRADFQVDDVRPLRDAGHITVPIVVVAGALDQRSPVSEARDIVTAAGPLARLVILSTASHDDILARCGLYCLRLVGALARPMTRIP